MLGSAMRAIAQPFTQKPDARSFHHHRAVVCADRKEQHHPSRKDIIKNAMLLPIALPALWGAIQQPALADDVPAAAASPLVAPPKPKAYIARDFFFQYNPAEFQLIQDPKDLDTTPGKRKL